MQLPYSNATAKGITLPSSFSINGSANRSWLVPSLVGLGAVAAGVLLHSMYGEDFY